MDEPEESEEEEEEEEEETCLDRRRGQGRALSDVDYSVMCELAQNGKTEELSAFLSKLTHVGRRTLAAPRRYSPLTLAARFGRESTVRYLLRTFPGAVELNPGLEEFSQDPELRRELRHDLPLYWASLEGHLEVAKLLVSAGARVNLPNCMQATALHAAATSGYLRVMEYLISRGADVNASDHLGTTPLMAAAGQGHLKAVQYLLKRRADVNCKTVDGYTVLHVAAWTGHLDILKKLLRDVSCVVSDSNLSDKDDTPSPLFLAASSGHERVVAELLSHQSKLPPSVKSDAYMLLGAGRLKVGDAIARLRARSDQGVKDVEDYWKKALAIRKSCQLTQVFSRVPEYRHRAEVNSSEELLRVFSSECIQAELLYQSFLILERCLGYGNRIIVDSWHGSDRIDISHRFRTDAFDHRLMEMAIHCWEKDLERCVYRHPSELQLILENYLQCFSSRSSNLLSSSAYPAVVHTIKALDILQVVQMRYKCEADSIQSILSSLLYIIAVWLHKDHQVTQSGLSTRTGSYSAPETLEAWGRKLVRVHLYSVEGKTLLHIALSDHRLSQEMAYGRFLNRHNKDSEALSMTPLIHALVRWGADAAINLADWNGQRPLHLAARWANKTSGDVDVVTPLLHCGAHLDYVNREGKTPLDECTDQGVRGKFVSLLSPDGPLKLSCLACRRIVKAKLPYKELHLPPQVRRIIECHDSNIY